MNLQDKLQTASTAGLVLLFTGTILEHLTHSTAARIIGLCGVIVVSVLIIYKLAHWRTYRDQNIVLLLMLGFMAFVVICIWLGVSVQ